MLLMPGTAPTKMAQARSTVVLHRQGVYVYIPRVIYGDSVSKRLRTIFGNNIPFVDQLWPHEGEFHITFTIISDHLSALVHAKLWEQVFDAMKGHQWQVDHITGLHLIGTPIRFGYGEIDGQTCMGDLSFVTAQIWRQV